MMESYRSLPAAKVIEKTGCLPVAISLPVRLRYDVDWGGPNGSQEPIIHYYFRDRWLLTWSCVAADVLSGRLDAFFARPVWLRLALWSWQDENWFGVLHALYGPGDVFEYLGPVSTRAVRMYGPDEGGLAARDCLISRLHGRPDVAVDRLITSLNQEQ